MLVVIITRAVIIFLYFGQLVKFFAVLRYWSKKYLLRIVIIFGIYFLTLVSYWNK